MTTIRAFFSANQGTFFQFLKKGRGDSLPLPPPPTPSSYASEFVVVEANQKCLQITTIKCKLKMLKSMKDLCFSSVKRLNSLVFIQYTSTLSEKAMYKTRNTGTGNGMRRTREIGGMLYSGECCQTFQGMSSNIPGNVAKHSGEYYQRFRGKPTTG